MEIKDLKYLLAYTIPLTTVAAIYFGGYYGGLTILVAFGLIPLMETFTPLDTNNLSAAEERQKDSHPFFTMMLYGNVILIYAILGYFIYSLSTYNHTVVEITLLVLSVGIMLGSNGINVAHELGHKPAKISKIASALLLLPNLYMHFTIEHNYGHHLKVGTPEDPATSRLGEHLFEFWWRSISQSYTSAWEIESTRLSKINKNIWSHHNQLIVFGCIQTGYIIGAGVIFSWLIAWALFLAGIVGILLLESINYIEHYGLLRKKLPNGRYELVEKFHSWNSDHEVGRILLYELTRHSDHHYKANKKYQILKHYDESPQLPFGYPTSIIIALIPPLWFKIMNPRVEEWRQTYLS
ncbi:MAG: alkane 1-monooxygenase [Saprospiraceae bacterium]